VKLLPRSNPSFPAVVTLKESGFKTSPYLQFPIYGGVENWLGYFKEEPSWPHEAFASIWQDINMIKTKDWCLVRARSDGDYWGMSGKLFPLKYGDMVVVTTIHAYLHWNDSNYPLHQENLPSTLSLPKKRTIPVMYLYRIAKIDLKEDRLYLEGVAKVQ
jgi:hypothetical protein